MSRRIFYVFSIAALKNAKINGILPPEAIQGCRCRINFKKFQPWFFGGHIILIRSKSTNNRTFNQYKFLKNHSKNIIILKVVRNYFPSTACANMKTSNENHWFLDELQWKQMILNDFWIFHTEYISCCLLILTLFLLYHPPPSENKMDF